MEVENIKWENYDIKSLDFILNESENLLTETFKSFRELTNRCYYALGLYIAIFSFSITSIIDNKASISRTPFLLIIVGICFACYKIYPALIPTGMVFPGTKPANLLLKYFEEIPLNDQLNELKIQTIVASNNGIEKNEQKLKEKTDSFKGSIYVFLITGLFCLFCFYMKW